MILIYFNHIQSSSACRRHCFLSACKHSVIRGREYSYECTYPDKIHKTMPKFSNQHHEIPSVHSFLHLFHDFNISIPYPGVPQPGNGAPASQYWVSRLGAVSQQREWGCSSLLLLTVNLVDGFNHFGKYESQWEGLHPTYEMDNKKCLKPPTRNELAIKYLKLSNYVEVAWKWSYNLCPWNRGGKRHGTKILTVSFFYSNLNHT